MTESNGRMTEELDLFSAFKKARTLFDFIFTILKIVFPSSILLVLDTCGF